MPEYLRSSVWFDEHQETVSLITNQKKSNVL